MTRTLGAVTLSNGTQVPALALVPGSSVCVIGAANSGKTEYCRYALGYPDPGTAPADGAAPPPDPSAIGYIPTDPTHVFSGIKSTLKGEFELTYQFLSRDVGDFRAFAEAFELENKLNQNPFTLSGGEAVKAAIAIVAAKRPAVWVLDQVYDALAPEMRRAIRDFFERCLADGASVLEAHARAPAWVADGTVCVLDGTRRLAVVGVYDAVATEGVPDFLLRPETRLRRVGSQRIPADRPPEGGRVFGGAAATKTLDVANVTFRYRNSDFELRADAFSLRSGECVSLIGPNGAGKTTLLRLASGLLHPASGGVSVNGATPKIAAEWASEILYSFQNPDDQIYHATVREEVYSTAKTLKRQAATPDAILDMLGLADDLDCSPSELAFSKRRLVSIAGSLLAAPPFIALDEPTAVLDERQVGRLLDVLRLYKQDGGGIAVVSHDLDFLGEIADRLVLVEEGRITGNFTLEEWPDAYAPFALRETRGTAHPTASFRELLRRSAGRLTM